MSQAKIIACAMERYDRRAEHPFCEAPKHYGEKRPSYAIIVIKGGPYTGDPLFQAICKMCYKEVETNMGKPIWGEGMEPTY